MKEAINSLGMTQIISSRLNTRSWNLFSSDFAYVSVLMEEDAPEGGKMMAPFSISHIRMLTNQFHVHEDGTTTSIDLGTHARTEVKLADSVSTESDRSRGTSRCVSCGDRYVSAPMDGLRTSSGHMGYKFCPAEIQASRLLLVRIALDHLLQVFCAVHDKHKRGNYRDHG